MPRDTSVGFWLTATPGLVGVFGLGHLYMGRKTPAEPFLIWTAALLVCVLISFVLPGLAYYWGYLPIAWGVGYFLVLVDIVRVAKRPRVVKI